MWSYETHFPFYIYLERDEFMAYNNSWFQGLPVAHSIRSAPGYTLDEGSQICSCQKKQDSKRMRSNQRAYALWC